MFELKCQVTCQPVAATWRIVRQERIMRRSWDNIKLPVAPFLRLTFVRGLQTHHRLAVSPLRAPLEDRRGVSPPGLADIHLHLIS